MLRIVIDTNLWISFLISKRYNALDKLLIEKRCKLVFSTELLVEFIEVVQRPKLRRYIGEQDLEVLLSLFELYGDLIDVKTSVRVCRDKKDNFLLALAKDGHAQYLITGDEDLLVIERFGSTRIVTFAEFLLELQELP